MSESSMEVSNASAFQHASLGKQITLAVVTVGLYNFYWFYKTAKQLDEGTTSDFDAMTATVLLFIPVYGLWNFAETAQVVTDQDHEILFLAFVFSGGIAGWYLVQSGINQIASGG